MSDAAAGHGTTSPHYQRHIDGLRAVAVLAVVLYHFGVPGFRGGYVGVDVFFVISGFLITRLIMAELYETGRFDFGRFYVRRMRRLLPALGITIFASLAPAMVLLSPEQFQRFGRSMAAAAISVSNILFWRESGYFDVDSHFKPLLHTWSLGVEEQFYLVWPAFLWVCARTVRRSRHAAVLAAVGLVSLAANYAWVASRQDVDAAATVFFLTPFRIYELALGALALYVGRPFDRRPWLHDAAFAGGLGLIGYATVTADEALAWPYLPGVLPCVGAFLVILADRAHLLSAVLTNRVAVGVGLVSYSAYLVHWPLVVFWEQHRFAPLGPVEQAGGIALTGVLALLLYTFIEVPFRRFAPTRAARIPQRPFVVASLASLAAILLLGAQIAASDGWVWRRPTSLTATAVAEGKQHRFNLFLAACKVYDRDAANCRRDRPFQILVLGDSHEPDGFNEFAAVYGSDPDVELMAFGAVNDCNVQFTAEGMPFSTAPACAARVAALADPAVARSLSGVVFSPLQPFHPVTDGLWRTLAYLRRMNPRIAFAVVGGFIHLKKDCAELFDEFQTFAACKSPDFVTFAAFDERAQWQPPAEAAGLPYVYIDKMALLCRRGTLESCVIEANGEPAFYDVHHLSFGFATYLGKRIASAYGEELVAAGFPPPARDR